MFEIESASLWRNQNLLSFVGRVKSDGVKRNHENKMKSNDGIPSHHGSENEGTCFSQWFFK